MLYTAWANLYSNLETTKYQNQINYRIKIKDQISGDGSGFQRTPRGILVVMNYSVS